MKYGLLFCFMLLSFLIKAQTGAIPEVAINEIMASNGITQKDPAGEYDDWIELYNNTSTGIDLSNWYMSDDYKWKKKWQFPSGSTIAPKGYLIIWCDSQLTQVGLHSNYKLNKGGEEVMLCKPDTSVIDSITFGKQRTDTTFARIPNGTGAFVFSNPTFNGANSPVGLSITKNNPGQNIRLYPNPTGARIALEGIEITSVKVFNAAMQEIAFITNLTPGTYMGIDICNYKKGVYYLEIREKDSKALKKFIVN